MIELGTTPKPDDQRDAIHIACIPLTAGRDMTSRFFVLIDENTAIPTDGKPDGIVDPFLQYPETLILQGDRFWGIMMPNTVTGMRHHWDHPKLPNKKLSDSEAWLRKFAHEWNFDFDTMVSEATSNEDWKCIVAEGIDLHSRGELGEDYYLFWDHLENYTGKTFDTNHRESVIWSCSC